MTVVAAIVALYIIVIVIVIVIVVIVVTFAFVVAVAGELGREDRLLLGHGRGAPWNVQRIFYLNDWRERGRERDRQREKPTEREHRCTKGAGMVQKIVK